MQRDNPASALITLVCLTVFAAVFVIYTTRYLPDIVATHFGAGNRADGWMSRNGYLLFMLSFMIGVSSFVSFIVGTLPRKFPQWTNVPNRDYWLAPARREESLRYLNAHGKRLGCLIVMMMLGMHYVILKANYVQPPMLRLSSFTAIMLGFSVALIWWIVRLYRRFPKPSS
ncbi:MAG: DUF1648 domain-containing protein [Deltaproteobacteria bacterium]|nr:DUF1648 domain-containing protein [Deltaproteobacteria bacterium]